MPTWEEIARDHGRFLYTVAYRLTGNHDDAQDLVQEVLLRVRRGLATFTPGSLEGWLSRITTNAFLDDVRKRKRRPLEVVPDLPDALVGVDADPEAALAAAAPAGRRPGRAARPAARLPRAAGAVRRRRPATTRRSPSTLDIPPGTVRSRIHRGRALLRKALTRMTPHPGDLLSAYADGELTRDRAATASTTTWSRCPSCRQELAATTEAKSWVTSLPEVLPPFGFYERMLLDPAGGRARRRTLGDAHRRRRPGRHGVDLAGRARTVRSRRPAPLRRPGAQLAGHLHDQSQPQTDTTTDQAVAMERAASLGLPSQVDDYVLSDVTDRGREQQAVYRDGDLALSIFLYQRYEIDPSQLPADAVERDVVGRTAWIVPGADGPMLVTQIGQDAVIFVGGDAQPAVAGDVDPHTPSRSMADRIEGAGEGLLQAFGLG